MKKENIKLRIEELKSKINKHNYEYYVLNQSSIEDFEFDKLLNELINLENENPNFFDLNSPTQNVGTIFSDELFKKKKHPMPMLSIKNAFNFNDLLEFDSQIKKNLEKNSKYSFVFEPKIDGVSISLNYKNGKLIKALTRGDGKVGDDVTQNVYSINSIPKKIKILDDIEIRGEIYIKNIDFLCINNSNENEKKYSNPRNLASGTLRQLNHNVVKERNLNFFAFQVFNLLEKKNYFNTQWETLKNLQKNNFSTNKFSYLLETINESEAYINKISKIKNDLDYEIDGIVIKINEFKYYETLGVTTKFPKWLIAYKFPAEIKKTILKDIFPTIGRTGKITYNALFEEFEILGTKVKRSTLHNSDYIMKMKLNIGDEVLVKKAGEIIPKVVGVSKKNNLEIWEESKNCPSCNRELIRYDGEVDQYCENINCPSQLIEKIIHFVSRGALNIIGLSIKQIELFYEKKFIRQIDDIFNLKIFREEILKIKGYKEKSIDKILNSIEESKKTSLEKVLFGLGIRHIGEKSSLDLAKKYKSIDKISTLSFENLINDEDFGEVKAKSLSYWFSIKENIEIINSLKKSNLNFNYVDDNVPRKEGGFFYNKNILITGKHKDFNREQLKKYFLSLGANIYKQQSPKVDYYILGEKPSEKKIEKVESVKIINIEEVFKNEKYKI